MGVQAAVQGVQVQDSQGTCKMHELEDAPLQDLAPLCKQLKHVSQGGC